MNRHEMIGINRIHRIMITGKQVTTIFQRASLRHIRSTPLLTNNIKSCVRYNHSANGLCARQFTVLTSSGQNQATALQRLTAISNSSWRLRAIVNDVEQSLPVAKGCRYYNRRLVEALELSDYNRAWAIVETLCRRHLNKAMLWKYTYNLMLRHYCKQQKTLANSNLMRILVLLDVMVAQGCANQISFQVVMAACSRARHLRSARHVLEKMRETGITPDERIYGFLINCCARKQGLVKMAERWYNEMRIVGIRPTALVINALLRVYSRDCGRSKVMWKLVEHAVNDFGVVPDTVTTRTMVYYLLCEGNVNGAVKFLQQVASTYSSAESAKLPVTRPVVNALVDACRQRGEWDLAEYALTLVERTDEEGVSAADLGSSVQDSTDLRKLVAKRDAISVAVVRALADQDWSHMTQVETKAFFLSRNQNESYERALEYVRTCATPSKKRAIQRLSLNLEGKLRLLDALICTSSASAEDFNAVLDTCGRQGHLADATSVMMKMKKYAEVVPECTPTIWSYNALLNGYAVCGDVCHIESIVREMNDNDVQLDQVAMNTVIKAHIVNLQGGMSKTPQARLHTVMQALSFYEWCNEDQKLNSGAATYYMLFRLFATYLELPCEQHNYILNDKDLTSNEDYSEEVMDGHDGELTAWMEKFIRNTCHDAPLESLDISVFNNAFACYYRLGDVDESFALFNLMRKRGFEPDDTTLGLMFATCASQQQFKVGLQFLDHLMTIDGYKPTLKVLTGAMQLCANSKNPDGALELFRAIESSGTFSLTAETFEPMVFAYARVGNVASAWEIANEMEEKLGRVSVSIYNRILLACVEAAFPGRALEVLGVIQNKEGVTPDIVSYNTALEAFVTAGERAAWWRKSKRNWEGDDGDADYEIDEGSRIEEDYVGSGDVNKGGPGGGKSTLSSSCTVKTMTCSDHEPEKREKVAWVRASILGLLDKMQQCQVRPDMTTYERAIAACSVNEDSEGVINIFGQYLIDRKLSKNVAELKSNLVTESSFSAYLMACTSLQDKDRVIEASTLLHKWHTATGQVPPAFLATQLLNSLDDLGEWHRAVRMLPNWQALFGAPPHVAIFNRVMQMCNDAKEYQLVAPIYSTMQDAAAYRVHPDAESYIQRIYAEEQRENWVAATDLLVEMQKTCPSDAISHQQLQKIALGRYSLRQKSC